MKLTTFTDYSLRVLMYLAAAPGRFQPARTLLLGAGSGPRPLLALRDWGAEIICLAGFMRMLSPGFVERRLGQLINIHPSLLPLFRGLDTHRRALQAGVSVHGCTVHFVTPELDRGPIIAQAAVQVDDEDTPDTLAAKVLTQEHQILPYAVRLFCEGRLAVEGLRVRTRPARGG